MLLAPALPTSSFFVVLFATAEHTPVEAQITLPLPLEIIPLDLIKNNTEVGHLLHFTF